MLLVTLFYDSLTRTRGRIPTRQGSSVSGKDGVVGVIKGRSGGNTTGGTLSILDNRTTNIGIASGNLSHVTVLGDIQMHNAASVVKNGSPLILVSNIASSMLALSAVCPTSVRDFHVLGGTTRATVCNSHKTSNIVRIGAGGNAKEKFRVSCRNGIKFRRVCGRLRVLGTTRCITATGTLNVCYGGKNFGASGCGIVAHANVIGGRCLTFDKNAPRSGCHTSFKMVSRGAVVGGVSCGIFITGISMARGTFGSELAKRFKIFNSSFGGRSVFSARVLFCSTTYRGPAFPTNASRRKG